MSAVVPEAELRASVVGCGSFAQNLLHTWSGIEGVRLVAASDRDLAKAEAAGRMFGIPAVYADAAEMLRRERLDFVDIVSTMPPRLARTSAHTPAMPYRLLRLEFTGNQVEFLRRNRRRLHTSAGQTRPAVM